MEFFRVLKKILESWEKIFFGDFWVLWNWFLNKGIGDIFAGFLGKMNIENVLVVSRPMLSFT